MDNITLQDIRQQISTCFERAGDALFNLVDALVSESQAQSLPELSFSAFFERKWPSVYEALSDGRINVKQLRAVLVKTLLAQRRDHELVCIALDTSNRERADAKTTAEFLRACQQLNSRVLVRLKSDRKLSRPGGRIHKRGPVPKDGPLLQGKRKETHGQPNAVCLQPDSKGRSVRISRWDDLHLQQDRLLTSKSSAWSVKRPKAASVIRG